MSVRYICYFDIGTGEMLSTEIPDIATAMHGFWVDDCYELTNISDDLMYWIAPGAVKYVKREESYYGFR